MNKENVKFQGAPSKDEMIFRQETWTPWTSYYMLSCSDLQLDKTVLFNKIFTQPNADNSWLQEKTRNMVHILGETH